MKIIIIGSGPAGLNAAIHASNKNNNVTIIEKNEKAGKKLFITGKGRCNVTNDCSEEDFINNVIHNKYFLYSSIYNFSSTDTINFFNDNNCPLIIERGNRVFPASYKSYDITNTLVKKCHQLGVGIHYNEEVISISKKETCFVIKTNLDTYTADKVVIATGGLAYPATGSTGDGYSFAKRLGHTITPLFPGLTGIKVKDIIPTELYDFTLKNVSLNVKDGKFKNSEFGELTLRNNYLDGPIAITTSSLINTRGEGFELELDLKPALSEEKLLARINREIEANPNDEVIKIIKNMLPYEFIDFFLSRLEFEPTEKGCNFSNIKRKNLVDNLKHFKFHYLGLNGFERSIVTSGGISVKEIDSSTMESKIVPGLYFAGEVIDVDAFTGGFNIQIALSTGALAGDSIRNLK